MNVASMILFLIAGIGAFNGLLIGLYYLWSSFGRQLIKSLFGLLVILLSLRVVNSVLLYFDRGIEVITLPIGMLATFLTGPVLYFLVLFTIQKERSNWQIRIHGGLGLFLLLAILFLRPYSDFAH